MLIDDKRCSPCGSTVRNSNVVCLSCGSFVTADGELIVCENHGSEQAIGVCVVCGKPVCGDCALSVNGRTYCDIVEHQSIHSRWKMIHETRFEFEADLIERNLEQGGIECRTFALGDHAATFWLEEMRIVRVLVPMERASDAVVLLQRLQLISEPTHSQ
jgi:hypothetical protein